MKNLTLKSKFTAFTALVVLIIGMMSASSWLTGRSLSASYESYATRMEAIQGQMRADQSHDAIRGDVLEILMRARANDMAGVAAIRNDLQKHVKDLRESTEAVSKLDLDTDTRDALKNTNLPLIEYVKAAESIAALAAGDFQGAESQLLQFMERFKVLEKEMAAVSERIDKSAETARKSSEAAAQSTSLVLVILGFVVALLLAVMSYWLARSVLRPLGGDPAQVASLALRVAAGDLTTAVKLRVGDADSVMAAMHAMQSSVKSVTDALIDVSEKHDAGVISYRIDPERFAGAYADLAQRVNCLLDSHISTNAQAIAVVTRYAKGDLSVDMDRLPGEKSKITEAIDGVKSSLSATNAEIAKLVEAAARGDFTVRGDESKFEYEFRTMVAGLNQLMQTSESGLNEVSRVLGALAKGDLTDKMSGEYQGTFAQLKQDCNQTVENLTAIVNQINEASQTIDTASKEITQGNTDLSQRTEEQASSLEETASSMEELTSTVKQNAENARQANQLAVGASDVAVKGGDVVKQVVTTMSGISESSKKIADIIGVIDGIAFQTNILALNAAVEAARAGEQGRGFAVVATEVRNLAQRSANAAKEIKGLITDSVSRVDTGTQLVDEAGKTMNEIVTSVKRVTDIMAEITAASQEQSSGIEQVNQAITQMDEVTQQNAALVEEAAAAAESMQEQSGNLVRTVSAFKVGQMAERRSPRRATNVTRIVPKTTKPAPSAERMAATPAPATTTRKVVGSDEDWQEF